MWLLMFFSPDPDIVDKDTRLSTILWKFASDFPAERENLLSSLQFKQGNSILGFETEVPSGGGDLILVRQSQSKLYRRHSYLLR